MTDHVECKKVIFPSSIPTCVGSNVALQWNGSSFFCATISAPSVANATDSSTEEKAPTLVSYPTQITCGYFYRVGDYRTISLTYMGVSNNIYNYRGNGSFDAYVTASYNALTGSLLNTAINNGSGSGFIASPGVSLDCPAHF